MLNQIAELSRLEASVKRHPVDVKALGYSDDGITLDRTPISSQGLERISSLYGIPSHFLPKVSPPLAVRLLKEFAGRTERQVDALVDTDARQVVSFARQDHTYLKASRYMKVLEPLAPTKVAASIHQSNVFYTDPEAFEVVKGDQVHFAVSVRTSMDGTVGTRAQLAMIRPTCANGAYLTEASWTLGRRDPSRLGAEELLDELKDAAHRMLETNRWRESLQALVSIKIEDPHRRISSLVRQLGLTSITVDRVLSAYEEEPNPTGWGVFNALTRAANGLSPERAEALWEASAKVVESGDACQYCATCPSRDGCAQRASS